MESFAGRNEAMKRRRGAGKFSRPHCASLRVPGSHSPGNN